MLLPTARRVVEQLEADVRHCLLPISLKLERHEQLVVTSRIKDCESALEALRRRQEGRSFDSDRADSYTLTALNDLAGVRVLVFPRSRWWEADRELRRERFASWTPDPVPSSDPGGDPLAFKYFGFCSASAEVRGEVQIVPMLIGLFWQVEHSAMYKPSPDLKGVVESKEMDDLYTAVIRSLRAFEGEFERLIRRDPLSE